jgi:hypothetical protein
MPTLFPCPVRTEKVIQCNSVTIPASVDAMLAPIHLLLAFLLASRLSASALEAEGAALRQQIIVLCCELRGQAKRSNTDRLFFVWLYRLFPWISRAMLVIRAETLGPVDSQGIPIGLNM